MTDAATPPDAEQDEATDIDPQQAEQDLATAPDKNKLYDLLRDTIPPDIRNYAIAPVLTESFEAVFRGNHVGTDGGSPGAVGHFLVSLQGFLNSLDADVLMTLLNFASSVHVELRPVVPESAATMARDLAQTDPQGVPQRSDLKALIPTSVTATYAAVRILDQENAHEAIQETRRYGVKVTNAYVALARTVRDAEGEVSLAAPRNQRVATFKAATADRVIRESARPETLPPQDFKIVGILTRTDSEEERFRVALDTTKTPPELPAQKRFVEGPYTEEARKHVEENGLWNQRVIADIRGYPERSVRRAKPGFSRYEFRGVRRSSS